MSFLRVCAFYTRLNRRSLFVKCAARVSLTECCQSGVSRRSDAVRGISETPLLLQRTNKLSLIPNTEDGQKRVLARAQLLDVLEARINQLQSDIVLDVQHAKVNVVRGHSSAKRVSSGKGTRGTPKEKTDIPKSGQIVAKGASESLPSRWLEKLTKEKKNNLKRKQNPHRKPQENVEKKPLAKCNDTKSSCMLPSTSYKTISTKAKNTVPLNKKNIGHMTLSDSTCAAVSSSITTTPAKSRWLQGSSKKPVPHVMGPDEAEELERWLSQQVSQRTYSSNSECQQEKNEESSNLEATISINSYLEAFVCYGNVEKVRQFLLKTVSARRAKCLNTDTYNIMLRILAKEANLNEIRRVFRLIEKAGLKPNLGSFCAALECMGRIERFSKHTVRRCLLEMKKNDLSVADMFSQLVFRRDERDMVLKAIHLVKPDYQPVLNVATNQCPLPLVRDFYTQRADHRYPKLDFTWEELQERFERQLGVEQACSVTIKSVEAHKDVTTNMARMRKLLAAQRKMWKNDLLKALREHKMILADNKHIKANLYPYLCLLKDSEYVDIMLKSVATLPPNGDSLLFLASCLGSTIYNIHSVQQKQKNQVVEKLDNVYNAYAELLAKDNKEYDVLPRERWCELEMKHRSGPTLQGGELSWPYKITLELGAYLLELMVKSLKMNSDILKKPSDNRKLIPILYHMYTFRSTHRIGCIKPHPILSQMQQEAMETTLTFDSNVMPMLCPPIPWCSVKFGAYLLTPTKLMRAAEGSTEHIALLEKCQNLHPVLDSLNQLGNCAWKVNKPILDIIISIFNDQGNNKLDIPPPLSEAPKIPHFNSQDPPSEKANKRKEMIDARKKYNEMLSLRISALYKLSIANHMRDEIFWFPHNLDFRGRTYPCPTHFNHLGSDVSRAILLFAEGKPLGSKGLDWLKIHLINLTGLKKRCSLQERLEFANTIMEDILDSADKPLNGKKWWMNADEPWQALACCMEISNAVRSPDPTQFICHFPVHQDGSCNGLQHYAALGRDAIGARSVNLVPCEVPQDVYSRVAEQVEELRVQDAKKGLKIAQVLEGFISRKVVKQTVMTVVYGVTKFGGRLQIEKRLREIDDFPKDHVWQASQYLVRQVFSSLNTMFTATKEIQGWLTESAKHISNFGHSVEWVTPLGLPVIQPYHKTLKQVVNNPMQNITLKITHDAKMKPNTMKQKNAFPPNFIHSLDSSHMMLTALHCYSAGLAFISVHDCFWTHPQNVDTMNKMCREQFVALHNQPILQDLSKSLLHTYCANPPCETRKKRNEAYEMLVHMLAQVPQTGDFDLQQVKESTYFFS